MTAHANSCLPEAQQIRQWLKELQRLVNASPNASSETVISSVDVISPVERNRLRTLAWRQFLPLVNWSNDPHYGGLDPSRVPQDSESPRSSPGTVAQAYRHQRFRDFQLAINWQNAPPVSPTDIAETVPEPIAGSTSSSVSKFAVETVMSQFQWD